MAQVIVDGTKLYLVLRLYISLLIVATDRMVTNMEYDNFKLKLYHLELQLKIRNWNCEEEFLLQQLLMEKIA